MRCSAPGKVILFGEHAVVHGHAAIAGAVSSHRTTCQLSLSEDDAATSVSVQLERGVTVSVSLAEMKNVQQKHQALFGADTISIDDCKAFISTLHGCATFDDEGAFQNSKQYIPQLAGIAAFYFTYLKVIADKPLVSLSASITSNIPMGSGMGSSAAFSASLSMALLYLLDAPPCGCSTNSSGLPCDACLPTLVKMTHLCEIFIHGNPSGVDGACATMGGSILFIRGKGCTTISHPLKLSLLLTHTGVPRNTSLLVAGVKELKESFESVINPILESMGAIATHVALTDNLSDAELVTLMHTCQCLLDSIGVGHPAITRVVQTCAALGIRGCKLTGAGGGGSVITNIQGVSDETVEKLVQELQKVAGQRCFKILVGGEGVMRELST